jgi:Putative  PD-(D/E)XK family member, (DUF4420)
MSAIRPEVWAKLEQTGVSGDSLVAQRGIPELTERFYCALDAMGRRHLLIVIELDDQELQDTRSRGVEVQTRQLVSVQEAPSSRYVDVTCLDPIGKAVFDLIGAEFAEGLARNNMPPAEVVKRVLKRWRNFWGLVPLHLLSREEQLGLFAELWFLSVWLLPKIGPSAVFAWRGPFRSRHDFELSNNSIEVKATTSSRGRIHRIHGLDQLEPPENGNLSLFSLLVREESGASNNLPAVIESCRQQLLSDDAAMTSFENALLQTGYSPVHSEEYAKLYLRIKAEALFAVRDDFPRLQLGNFSGGLPEGVEQIEYEININAFDHLIIARTVTELSL